MYSTYFSFRALPFECNLDQRFLYLSDSHREVLAAILYFITEKKGFALVCGDVGTGKTMLINQLLSRIPENVHAIRVSVPDVDYTQLLLYIARSLGIQDLRKNVLDLHDDVESVLTEMHRKDRQVVLIIDEAHLLTNRSLEYIRILSNIETAESKLLQILLVGQYELSSKLDCPEMRPLRQRININRFLMPMSAAETIAYINHRLELVGSSYAACFESGSEGLIWRLTQGVPRRINQLCDNALLICEAEGKRKVNRKLLNRADEALRTDRMFTPRLKEEKSGGRAGSSSRRVIFASFGVLVLILASISASRGHMGRNAQMMTRKIIAMVSQSYRQTSQWMLTEKVKEIFAPETTVHSGAGRAGNEGDAGAQVSPRLQVIEQVSSPLEAKPSDIAALQGGSEQCPPSGSKSSCSNAALPGFDVAGGGASGVGNLTPPPLTDDPKDEGKSALVPGENVGSSATQSREAAAKTIPFRASDVETYQTERFTDGPAPFPEEGGNKEPNNTARETIPSTSRPSDPRDLFASENARHIVVKKGDTLAKIVAAKYPQNPVLGFKIIILANPTIVNPDQISPGQTIVLPDLDSVSHGIRFRDTNDKLLRLLRTQ